MITNLKSYHNNAVCVDKCPSGDMNETISCIPTTKAKCPEQGSYYPTKQNWGDCYPKYVANLT